MISTIPEALLTAMESDIPTDQFDTDPASYTSVARGIIKEILMSKNMSNEMESLQIVLDVTQRAAVQANTRLDQVLARGGETEVAHLDAGSRFPDVPVFDGKQPKELRSWILHRRNKLGAQPIIYAHLALQVRYAFNHFVRDSLYQFRHFISEETKTLDCADLNTFLEPRKMTYHDPD